MQPVSYQQPTMPPQQPMPPQQQSVQQQIGELIKVMRESPYPSQREWSAQSLTSFDWHAHPHIIRR